MKRFSKICGNSKIMGSSRFREVGVVKGLREGMKGLNVRES